MNYSKSEKETIIVFNEENNAAEIYTCNTRLKKKLQQLKEKNSKLIKFKNSDSEIDSITCLIPKKLISISMPRGKRILSEEQKDSLKRNMQAVRNGRK